MSIHDGAWPEGTPCWVDLQADDVPAARAFYAGLFGWEILDSPPEAGGYLMAVKDGRPVAGIGPKPADAGPVPSAWTTYFAADDADALVARVEPAGGKVFVPPFDVMDVGRMAVVADPAGAVFGVWQAKAHTGAGIAGEPGTMCWHELHTDSYGPALDFYRSVLGFDYDDIGDGQGFAYSVAKLPHAPEGVAGIFDDAEKPEGVPPYWLAWFAVADCDAAAAEAGGLGATVLFGPHDSPFGRMAVVQGGQGEVFAIIDLSTTAGERPGA